MTGPSRRRWVAFILGAVGGAFGLPLIGATLLLVTPLAGALLGIGVIALGAMARRSPTPAIVSAWSSTTWLLTASLTSVFLLVFAFSLIDGAGIGVELGGVAWFAVATGTSAILGAMIDWMAERFFPRA